MAKLSLKLLIDKEKNRVVFAESDKDFVDILLSFLTLPMGTIARLLDKKSEVGCIDKLYESVENLDTEYLQTEACKTMLLQPKSASEEQCEDLAIAVDDVKPRQTYRCTTWDCATKTHCLRSKVPGSRCRCGQVMERNMIAKKKEINTISGDRKGDGIFMKGGLVRFMISDDLHVTPISTETALSLIQMFGIEDANSLETRTVDVSRHEIMSLLKIIPLTKMPLTDTFLKKPNSISHDSETKELEIIDMSRIKVESEEMDKTKMICLRLLESKSANKVVYAEAGEDFIDVLFSFLTFPLGSIVKLLNKKSSLGCVDNLYQSVEGLSVAGSNYIKSEECKHMLLDPKVASHFGCSAQPLRISEALPETSSILGCQSCFDEIKGECSHGIKRAILTNVNPKLPMPGTELGGGFTKACAKFMVTDEMLVMPLSPISGIDIVKELQLSITNLVYREIKCGEKEVLNLLKASLISREVLTNAFACKNKRRMA